MYLPTHMHSSRIPLFSSSKIKHHNCLQSFFYTRELYHNCHPILHYTISALDVNLHRGAIAWINLSTVMRLAENCLHHWFPAAQLSLVISIS